MKGSRKQNQPIAFTDWCALENDNWKPTYSDLRGCERKAVIDNLFQEQRGLCVYCGRELDLNDPGKTYHIEHFRPQAIYKSLGLDYSNLFLSCGQEENGEPSKVCGTAKGDWFDEFNYIHPSYPVATLCFKFTLNGKIVPSVHTDTAALAMIESLNLNHSELEYERKIILELLDDDKLDVTDFFDIATATAKSYAHVAFQHAGQVIP